MSSPLNQTGAVGLTRTAEPTAKFGLLNGSEIIILAIKPSLWFVLLVSARVCSLLLAVCIAAWIAGNAGWLGAQTQLIIGIALAGISMRLAFGLLQWQSRAYILTNIRVLRIHGILRVEMFQCHLLRLKDVALTASPAEKLFGLGTIGLSAESDSALAASWLNVRHPEQVKKQILDAIDALKGHCPDPPEDQLPPASALPARTS